MTSWPHNLSSHFTMMSTIPLMLSRVTPKSYSLPNQKKKMTYSVRRGNLDVSNPGSSRRPQVG